jgi:hypothetical protein
MLRYIADGTMVGGDLWVLLGNSVSGPAAIRIRTGFAYFVRGDAAELVRVRLEGW